MNPGQLLTVLQLSDSLFPIGAFAFSDGLETAAHREAVRHARDVAAWLDHWRDHVFRDSEGPALVRTMRAYPDWNAIGRIDRELTALRPASEVRQSSRSLGDRMLAACVDLYPDAGLGALRDRIRAGSTDGNVAVVQGAVYRALGVAEREALLAFAYSRLAGTASAALRLVRVGQQAMQGMLTACLARVPATVEDVLGEPDRALRSFAPMMDFHQMEHRRLYSRLFRS